MEVGKMFKLTRLCLLLIMTVNAISSWAQIAPCPGFNPKRNVNLACEIATAAQISSSGNQTLGQLSPTLAAQLSQLPLTTVVSGSGLTFGKSGLMTASSESLGTILTQRGETIGKNHYFFSFNYQRFDFGSVDGISLKHLNTFNDTGAVRILGQNRVDLAVDQFAAIGSFGLTRHMDISVLVPFSKVTLKTGSSSQQSDRGNAPAPLDNFFFAGSATGIGDVAVNVKYNVLHAEHAAVALGGEVRFPTGDESNYLGTGAYGLKPYLVFSRRGRLTPNINIGYQWNGSSPLFVNTVGARQNLPSAFLYSGGLDYAVVRRLTVTAEFLGQAVINGPRLATKTVSFNGQNFQAISNTPSETYAMDNVGAGFKLKMFKGLLLTGNVLYAVDNAGLRSRIVPLAGLSYKF
jgi:hypothetical protein